MTNSTLRIGTRGSKLAIWQARWVQTELKSFFSDLDVQIITIKTKGDKVLDSPLSRIGGKGLFTKEIEDALMDGSIDLAVHSLKDLPTALPPGLVIGAVTEREDVRDVFIPHPDNPVKRLLDQPKGAKIATGSLRRASQVLNCRPDVQIVDVRGNLDTRWKKLSESGWSGMLLAYAGVARLGWKDKIGETLSPDIVLPAVGQGALGIEVREVDNATKNRVAPLHHERTAVAVRAERALLQELEGGCQVPIGAYARIGESREGEKDILTLDAMVGEIDGTTVVRGTRSGPAESAERMGKDLARDLLARGGDAILRRVRAGVRTSTSATNE